MLPPFHWTVCVLSYKAIVENAYVILFCFGELHFVAIGGWTESWTTCLAQFQFTSWATPEALPMKCIGVVPANWFRNDEIALPWAHPTPNGHMTFTKADEHRISTSLDQAPIVL